MLRSDHRLKSAQATDCQYTLAGDCIDAHPLAVFIFEYRSKSKFYPSTGLHQLIVEDALQILGVLPRTPEPVPLEERDPETLTPAEMLELIRRQKVSPHHILLSQHENGIFCEWRAPR